MSNYQTPGVYVQEISTLPASVVSVETAIPAFIGFTSLHNTNVPLADPGGAATKPTRPIKIYSFKEFVDLFGPAEPHGFTLTVHDDLDSSANGFALLKRTVTVTNSASIKWPLYYQIKMYFDNGGGPCYIVSAGLYDAVATTATLASRLTDGLNELEKEDEPTLILAPDAAFLSTAQHGTFINSALAHCAKMGDRFTISDVPAATVTAVDANFRDLTGMANLKYGAAYFPSLETTLSYYIDETTLAVTHTAVDSVNGDPLPAGPPPKTYMNTIKLADLPDFTVTNVFRETAVYNEIKRKIAEFHPTLFPCGAIAGIYCTVDRNRGVWKAPANISLKSVIGPSLIVTHEQQAGLNVNASSGKSVNAIRAFTGRGTLVYGARTLMGNDNEWRYVPVRRLFIMAEESIKKATEFVVFEPNDANTWQRVRAMIQNFLTGLWRNGALAGATPKEAFFVNCGLGTSMTSLDILEGNLIVEVGMAAVRPAEFIILKFSHKLQES